VQLGIASLLAFFFFALSRSLRLLEVRLWSQAWLANAAALLAVNVAAFFLAPGFFHSLTLAAYVAGKTSFVLLTLAGMGYHLQPGRKPPNLRKPTSLASLGKVWVFLGLWALCLAFFAPSLPSVQLAQSFLVAATFFAGALWVWKHQRFPRSRWLAVALFLDSALFASYLPALLPVVWNGATPAYLAIASFFDAGAELILGMTMLIALESSSKAALQHLHEELVDSYERLRAVVVTDPLTGLKNRQALQDYTRQSRREPVALIFFDLDNFKEINDLHGHLVGDACLIRLAQSLRASFRPADAVFRWGGDEFLVLAEGMNLAAAEERCQAVREAQACASAQVPATTLSVGLSLWLPGQELEEALGLADKAMYRHKQGLPHPQA
jgi:diguanylate cyclase (GGDEF)-like protein